MTAFKIELTLVKYSDAETFDCFIASKRDEVKFFGLFDTKEQAIEALENHLKEVKNEPSTP